MPSAPTLSRFASLAGRSLGLVLTLASAAHAQSSPTFAQSSPAESGGATAVPEQTERAVEATTPGPEQAKPDPLTLSGYVEAIYQWNFNDPSNAITHFRGFDNRHNTFTLSNVVLDAQLDYQNVIARASLQVGHTPSTYYLAEPTLSGASAANASDAALWKYVQQAFAGYRFGLGHGLSVVAGVFLSPIGPESMAVRDNWNWSRSNLFFGLPFYHTGIRASYAITRAWAVTLAGFNGWNSVVDNNREKSIMAQLTYTRPELALSLLYFAGVERAPGAPEGRAFRHLFDAHATWNVTPWLSLLAHANTGFEPNDFGVSAWLAGALYARARVTSWLYLAVRGEGFWERAPSNTAGRAARIFWPAPWVASGTTTLELRPHAQVSFRLEYRHDRAGARMYFGDDVAGDGSSDSPYAANRRSQDTLTLGLTAWF